MSKYWGVATPATPAAFCRLRRELDDDDDDDDDEHVAGGSDGLSGGHPCHVLPRNSGQPAPPRLLEVGKHLSRRLLRPSTHHRAVRSDD